MDHFLGYFLPRLAERVPDCAAVVEAIAEGYKICHPGRLDGSKKSHQTPSAILAERTLVSGRYASDKTSSCVMESNSNPHNLPTDVEDSKKSRPEQVPESKFVDGKKLAERLDSILTPKSFDCMLNSSNGTYTKVIGDALGMHDGPSRYRYFYPNDSEGDTREIRLSYHSVILTNIPEGITNALCITFVRPNAEETYKTKYGMLHNKVYVSTIDNTICNQYVIYHSMLKHDYLLNHDNICNTILYRIIKGIQDNLITGNTSQFPV